MVARGPLVVSVEEAINEVISKPGDISRRSTVTRPERVAACAVPDKTQIAASKPTHAHRITHAHLFGAHREIVLAGPLP